MRKKESEVCMREYRKMHIEMHRIRHVVVRAQFQASSSDEESSSIPMSALITLAVCFSSVFCLLYFCHVKICRWLRGNDFFSEFANQSYELRMRPARGDVGKPSTLPEKILIFQPVAFIDSNPFNALVALLHFLASIFLFQTLGDRLTKPMRLRVHAHVHER